MPVTRSQTSKRLNQASSSQSGGSRPARNASPNPSTPPLLSQSEQTEARAILDMLEPLPSEDLPDDFRPLHLDALETLKQFVLRDRALFEALQAKAPASHVRLNALRRDVLQTFQRYEATVSDLDNAAEEARFLQSFEQRILRFVEQFEGIREASPADFSLARLIVCALVWTLDKVVDSESGSEAQFDTRERLKRQLVTEINESASDAVLPYVDEIEEIIEKLEEKEYSDSPGGGARRLLQNKLTNIKNAMRD
ncbi:hypothetical protein FH972_021425 [Carpinus fangiana]|uniref:Uncharacterized protein n=1 Tax=Carpinus fangiana TaxID=176857 RepID=A0A5N6KPD0_9ROSI|nr:hypothetical protein FH972_021425 [Carpinus fangiana]